MITVYFKYRIKTGEMKTGEQYFNSVFTAIKFIKYVIPKSKDKIYLGYSCDDEIELSEMNRLL